MGKSAKNSFFSWSSTFLVVWKPLTVLFWLKLLRMENILETKEPVLRNRASDFPDKLWLTLIDNQNIKFMAKINDKFILLLFIKQVIVWGWFYHPLITKNLSNLTIVIFSRVAIVADLELLEKRHLTNVSFSFVETAKTQTCFNYASQCVHFFALVTYSFVQSCGIALST